MEKSENGSEEEDKKSLLDRGGGRDRESGEAENKHERELGESMTVEYPQNINPRDPTRISFQQVEFNVEEMRKGTKNQIRKIMEIVSSISPEEASELRVESWQKDVSPCSVSEDAEILLEGSTLPMPQRNKRKLCTINHPFSPIRRMRTRSSVAAEAF